MSIAPALYLAQLFLQSVQAPILTPRWLPGIIGPVTRCRIGLFADIPPISWAGVVLSQPEHHISIVSAVEANVLTTNEDHGVTRLSADHLLGIHAHEVSKIHACRRREGLSNAYCGEINS